MIRFAVAVAAVACVAGESRAAFTVGFTNISANSGAANAAAVASQLSFTVYESTPPTYLSAIGTLGANQYLVAFNNSVGTASNVHEIYVDDHLLNPRMGYVSIFNSLSGSTQYTVNGTGPTKLAPHNLPGALCWV